MGLLSKVSSLFGQESSPNLLEKFDISSSIVRNKTKIFNVLKTLGDEHKLLTVTLKNSEEQNSFTSSILRVHQGKNMLYLDEFNPDTAHELIMTSKSCHVATLFDGINVEFDAELVGTGKSDNIRFYGFRIPEKIKYHQRRFYHRVRVPRSNRILVRMRPIGKQLIQGDLRDISMGGFSVEMKGVPPDMFMAGERIDSCSIELTRQLSINTPVDVRSYNRDHASNKMILGAEFAELPKESKRELTRFVVKLDREARKLLGL